MKTKKKLEKVVSLTEETPEQTKKRPKSIKQKHKEVPWSEQIQLRRTPKAKSTELKKPEEVQLRLLKKVPVKAKPQQGPLRSVQAIKKKRHKSLWQNYQNKSLKPQ